ncbi:MAG: hydroxymethylglutaryl-CoA lyase [Deltaproteobacteria bacterium]|nr:MAG: hydroxymethylglutaryl-CoA lyase [Deltaproteobacteria bacterium]
MGLAEADVLSLAKWRCNARVVVPRLADYFLAACNTALVVVDPATALLQMHYGRYKCFTCGSTSRVHPMNTPHPVVHDVTLRDGLQIEERVVSTEQKLGWLAGLRESGVDVIQLGSFVHPKKVPPMADTDELFRRARQHADQNQGVVLSGLVLNEKGLERALAAGVDMICMGVSASETHSRKNTGMAVGEAVSRVVAMAADAVQAGKQVQLSVQSAFGCGFEGVVPVASVLALLRQFVEAGIGRISLADTAGHATPADVERLYGQTMELAPTAEWACHFHDTYGLGLANAYAALKAGVTVFESAVGGLGGCPFTKLAGGNLCTEDWVYLLHRMQLRQDVKLKPLLRLAREMTATFEHELPGTIHRTGLIGALTETPP